jgi:magnesium transporter
MSWIQMRPILSLSFSGSKAEVISELNDLEHAKDIVDLLRYDENSAGIDGEGISKVNENWNVLTCVKRCAFRLKMFRVHSIYR